MFSKKNQKKIFFFSKNKSASRDNYLSIFTERNNWWFPATIGVNFISGIINPFVLCVQGEFARLHKCQLTQKLWKFWAKIEILKEEKSLTLYFWFSVNNSDLRKFRILTIFLTKSMRFFTANLTGKDVNNFSAKNILEKNTFLTFLTLKI
mgnify:CR=1 FL=1